MAKPPADVPCEALMRFPYRGRPYFAGQRVMMAARDVEDAVATRTVKRVDAEPVPYRRRDMQAEDQ